MEMIAKANADENSVDVDHIHHQYQYQDPVHVPDASNSNHGDPESEPKHEFNEEETRGILGVIASTGKFWHDWDKLKIMLSFQLKQVLSEYTQAKINSEQQNASLGETHLELLKRLDEDPTVCEKHLSRSLEACFGT